MMFSCFCLNIHIETASNDFQKIMTESLNLNEEEKNDVFFEQELLQVVKLKNITKVLPTMVQTRTVGHWNINCCLNCLKETYAVHRDKGAACVVMSSKLLDSKSIEKIRNEQLAISKVFNVIINPGDISENINVINLYPNCDYGSIIKSIREVTSEFLRKEMVAVEERIKKYSEEQYEILNNLKDTAYEEHDSLVTLVQRFSEKTKPTSTNHFMESTQFRESLAKPFNLTEPISLKSNEKAKQVRHTPKKQKSSPAVPVTSYDAEGLFDFDGSDDVNSFSESDVGESDRDDSKDDRMNIPRQRSLRGSIAKSLPMNIPTFLSQARNPSSEDLDDMPQDDNIDIAASIKALAKSVHGDTVFGELPRPRLSTQI
ncbi:uncharacterized protein LOC130900593 isoform X1 [Diorhabda carinulata]|uniref:uncharacterized protein LOC130900593 isoform X1 n=1 Tax=Diorhabda carinulata TaxID=1163345 RepID=UPI0025A10A59|nr:uncharacterized protein LOC130900593 isoform X1 [Diorhabda carinulata]